MSENKLPEDLQKAIAWYVDLKKETHDAGKEILAILGENKLPHEVQMMMLGDIFLSYVFQNGGCNYLTDITINFKAHFEAWLIGQRIKENIFGSVKLQCPEEWPEMIGGQE
jgi:hypothetical protein